MSNITIQLTSAGHIRRVLSLRAEDLIVTDLTISSASASLPTLVSTENVIGQVNEAGFELVDPHVVHHISAVINTSYLPTAQAQWHDTTIALEVMPISQDNARLYQEIGYMRTTLIQSIQQARIYESQGDYRNVKAEQDRLVDSLQDHVQNRRSWWEKIPEFLLKTALPIVFKAFMGFSLHVLFASIFGAAFHVAPEYL
ncbi:MAG TPA: hypothetical protein VGF67_07620 [Ktedonobacteraceae bacterium]|jgi:hypothetical protein